MVNTASLLHAETEELARCLTDMVRFAKDHFELTGESRPIIDLGVSAASLNETVEMLLRC